MEQTNGRPSNTGSGTSSGNPPPVNPLWHEAAMALLRVERLASAAIQAIQSGDKATAARMTAELNEAVQEATELEKRAKAQ